MDTEEIRREYGTASLEPTDDVVAKSYATWMVTYTAGALGVDDGGQLNVAANMSSDWGRPQFDDPSADNYATVETSADATVEAHWDTDGHVRPMKDTVTIDVFDGALGPGDTVTLTLGLVLLHGVLGVRATILETSLGARPRAILVWPVVLLALALFIYRLGG
jgi:hypothetical protein